MPPFPFSQVPIQDVDDDRRARDRVSERCQRADGDVGRGVNWSWSGAYEAEAGANQADDEREAEVERGECGEGGA